MAIKPAWWYSVQCDKCEGYLGGAEDVEFYYDKEAASQAAEEFGWVVDKAILCDNCKGADDGE